MLERYSLTALCTPKSPWLTVLALALTALLLRFRPHERAVYLNTLWLFLLGVVGQAAASRSRRSPSRRGAVVHTIFRIVAAIALIRLVGFACSGCCCR